MYLFLNIIIRSFIPFFEMKESFTLQYLPQNFTDLQDYCLFIFLFLQEVFRELKICKSLKLFPEVK
jgi:hypothetical protein